MKARDFRFELRDTPTSENPNHCKLTIYNDSEIEITAPEIRIDTDKKWKILAAENFEIISSPDATLACGLISVAGKKTIPAKGHQEFGVTITPKITKSSYPKDFYLGFAVSDKATDLLSFKTEWEKKLETAAQYANSTVTLINNMATFEDPYLTFETPPGEHLSSAGGDVDIDPKGHGVVSSGSHDINFMEFSGGAPKNQLKKNDQKTIKLGVNRGSHPISKPLELPTKPWIGFEVSVALIPC